MQSASEDLSGQVLSRRFRVRRRMAEGGIATIYEVEHVITRRLGALKLLKPIYSSSHEAIERLIREASAATRIGNPHVVETLDAGRLDTGQPYLFMELLAGESLDHTLAREGRLPFAQTTDFISQAADGLLAAHSAGIVHRDIKPANLFVTANPKGFLKILDFGVSKFSRQGLETLTQDGRTVGTLSYMPPEQMAGAKLVDERADVFSLGVVLYECVTGQMPFMASSAPELALCMLSNRYVPASELRRDTPAEFDSLVARSLRAEAAERHTMQELRDGLASLQRRSSMSQTLAIGVGLRPVSEGPKTQPGIEPRAVLSVEASPTAKPRPRD